LINFFANFTSRAFAAIEILEKPESFEHILKLGNDYLKALESQIQEKNLPVDIFGVSPHCGPEFKDVGKLTSHDLFSVYQQSLIEKGILSVSVNNFCLEHTKEDVDKLIEASNYALDIVKEVIAKDSIEGILKCEKFRPIFRRN